jgi:hypothetical protein
MLVMPHATEQSKISVYEQQSMQLHLDHCVQKPFAQRLTLLHAQL